MQGLGVGIEEFRGDILVDNVVDLTLHLAKLRGGQLSAEVDGDDLASHVEAHIFVAEMGADGAGDQMLAAVLLHEHKAARPVDLHGDGLAHRQRRGAEMDDLAVTVADIQHGNAVQRPQVTGLSAAGGIENGAVKHDGPAAFCRLAAAHHSGAGLLILVYII